MFNSKTTSQIKTYSWQIYNDKGEAREAQAFQKPLTVRQEIQLSQVFRKFGLAGWEDLRDVSYGEFIDHIAKEGIIEDILDAILVRTKDVSTSDLMEIAYPVQKEILKDFLALNPQMRRDLNVLLRSKIITRIIQMVEVLSPQKKSSTSAQAEA